MMTKHKVNPEINDNQEMTAEDEQAVEDYKAKLRLYRDLLPAWFVPQMMEDTWSYGVMLTNGNILGIETIHRITQDASGGIWLDCRMMSYGDSQVGGLTIMDAPDDKHLDVSINAAHVAAVFEYGGT